MSLIKTNKIQPHTADAVDISALTVNGAELSGTIHVATLAELKAIDSTTLKQSQLAVVDVVPYENLLTEAMGGRPAKALSIDGGYVPSLNNIPTEAGLLIPDGSPLDIVAGPLSGVANAISDGFTVSFWFNYTLPDDNGSTAYIPLVGHGVIDPESNGVAAEGWHLYLSWNAGTSAYNLFARATQHSAGGGGVVNVATAITPNVWHHVAMTVNYQTGDADIYYDGDSSQDFASPLMSLQDFEPSDGITVDGETLHVGRFKNPAGAGYVGPGKKTFHGSIDDLTLWSGAFTQGELLGLVDTSGGGFSSSRIDQHLSYVSGNNYGWWSFGSDNADKVGPDTGLIKNIGSWGTPLDLVLNAGQQNSGAPSTQGPGGWPAEGSDLGWTMFTGATPASGSSSSYSGQVLSPYAWSKKSVSVSGQGVLVLPASDALANLGVPAGRQTVFSIWVKPQAPATAEDPVILFSRGPLYRDPTDAWVGEGYHLALDDAGPYFAWTDDNNSLPAEGQAGSTWNPNGVGFPPVGLSMLRSAVPLAVGSAYNIVVSIDYSAALVAKMYINGTEAATVLLNSNNAWNGSGTGGGGTGDHLSDFAGTVATTLRNDDLTIGGFYSANSGWILTSSVYVDDFAIWDNWAAFGSAYVGDIYNNGCPGDLKDVNAAKLFAYFRMGDSAGDVLGGVTGYSGAVAPTAAGSPASVNIQNVIYNQADADNNNLVPYDVSSFSSGVCYGSTPPSDLPPDSPGAFFWSPQNTGFPSYYAPEDPGKGPVDLGWFFVKPDDIAAGYPGALTAGRWVSCDSLGSWTYALASHIGDVEADNGLLRLGGATASQAGDSYNITMSSGGSGTHQQIFSSGSVCRLTYDHSQSYSFTHSGGSGGVLLPDLDQVRDGAMITFIDGSGHADTLPISIVASAGDTINGAASLDISAQYGAMTLVKSNSTWNTVSAGAALTLLDQDDLGDDSATAAATQQSIKAYVDAAALPGNSEIIAPFAFAYINTESAGQGLGIAWSAWDVATGEIAIVFAAAQPNANYVVVTDRELYEQHDIYISAKSTSGFTASFLDSPPSTNPLSPASWPGTIMVYGSTPTTIVGGALTLLDEDTLGAGPGSATAAATQQSIKAYVGDAVCGDTQTTLAALTAATSVGIGTVPNPDVLLEVQENGTSFAPDSATVGLFQRSGANVNGAAISIIGGTAGESAINLGDEDDEDVGRISYDHNTNKMAFKVGGTGDLATIDGSGNVGIGTNSPAKTLDVKAGGSGNGINLISHADSVAVVQLESGSGGGYIQLHNANNDQNVRLDAADDSWFAGGNLGIGETTPITPLHVKMHPSSTGAAVTMKVNAAADVAVFEVLQGGGFGGGADVAVATSAGETGSKNATLKIRVDGTDYWIRLYDAHD